ncbi:hypothetical protein J6590_027411 [Homalodisca vitripennis]|nr:hypothetical protein J6590_027411 [Homalodisca vitripennis]
MVWEQQTLVVVMTTRAVERGRVKCAQYWAETEGGTQTHGLFVVTTQAVEQHPDYVISSLLLHNTVTDESREVSHYQFTSWPDYGVPLSALAMLDFLQRVRLSQAAMLAALGDTWAGHPRGPPIVVHCSAGIGRTVEHARHLFACDNSDKAEITVINSKHTGDHPKTMLTHMSRVGIPTVMFQISFDLESHYSFTIHQCAINYSSVNVQWMSVTGISLKHNDPEILTDVDSLNNSFERTSTEVIKINSEQNTNRSKGRKMLKARSEQDAGKPRSPISLNSTYDNPDILDGTPLNMVLTTEMLMTDRGGVVNMLKQSGGSENGITEVISGKQPFF